MVSAVEAVCLMLNFEW